MNSKTNTEVIQPTEKSTTATYTVTAIKLAGGEETPRFQANIYKDGKKIGYVYNEGCGGCCFFRFFIENDEKEFLTFIEDWAKAKLASCKPEDKILYTMEESDTWVYEWIDKFEAQKIHKAFEAKLRKMSKTKTLFRLKSDQPNSWRSVLSPYDHSVHDFLIKKYGDQLAEIYGQAVKS